MVALCVDIIFIIVYKLFIIIIPKLNNKLCLTFLKLPYIHVTKSMIGTANYFNLIFKF